MISTARVAVLIVALLTSPLIQAQAANGVHPLLDAKWYMTAGYFFPQKDFKIRVDGVSPGDPIDLGDAFNLDNSQSTWAATMRWRFGKKWDLQLQYWKTDDSNTATLDEDVHWGDVVFEDGTFVSAGAGIKVARMFFGRRFSASDTHEFGLGAGIHWLKFNAFIQGQVLTNMGNSELYYANADAGIPLPNIGGWYTYAFSDKWALQSRIDWFSASYGDYSGGLWNALVGVSWAPTKHFGVAASWNYFSIDVDVDKDDWHGKADLSQNGPSLAVTAYW